MTFVFEKERIRALSDEGTPMGHISFPRVRPGLVNISQMMIHPKFRGQNVESAMMDALLPHLASQNLKAALTCPFAQQYIGTHPQWKHILPGEIHFTTH